jgi:hypothetical protein
VRYTSAAEPPPRRPGPLRGIAMVSSTGPNMTGTPVAGLTLPASTGLGVTTTTNAALLYAGTSNGVAPYPGLCAGRWHTFNNGPLAALGSSTITNQVFTLTDNMHHPANVSRVRVRVSLVLTSAAAANATVSTRVDVLNPTASLSVCSVRGQDLRLEWSAGAQVYALTGEFELPLLPYYPWSTAVPKTRSFNFVHNAAATATASSPSFRVVGWEYAS